MALSSSFTEGDRRIARYLFVPLAIGLVGIFVLLTLPNAQAASILYVSTTGTNSPTCGSVSSPCQTIQYAVSLASSGDTIIVSAGTYAESNISISKNLTINGAGQSATFVNGGGTNRVFDVSNGFTVTISMLAVQNGNASAGGGGFRNAGILNLSSLKVISSTASQGGGIENDSTGSLTMNGVTVSGNTSNLYYGGGIYNFGAIVISNSAIIGNSASGSGGGGGIYMFGGTAIITNSTISGNSATNNGGGLYNAGVGSVLTLTNVTINNNSASSGGGIYITVGSVQPKNTIVSFNPGGNCGGTSPTSAGYNIDSGNTCGLAGTGDLTNTNPLLAPLALYYPGTTMTHGLFSGSPALDQILSGTNGCGTTVSTDQRGVTRPQNGKCDIGAFEGALYPYFLPLIRK